MTDAIDWSKPCERFDALRKAYFALLTGQQEVEIRTRTLDAEEMVRFNQAKLDVLRNEMRSAESECAAVTGTHNRNRRHAIGCSYRPARRFPGYDPNDPRG